MLEPLDCIEWRDASSLNPNLWNPNLVLEPEHDLLVLNMEQHGWLHPLVVTKAGLIIDGFHRWRIARSSAVLRARRQGKVPCVVLDLNEPDAMLLTVRMNRAKGTHAVHRMAHLVQRLVNVHGLERAYIAKQIGATMLEVDLLYQNSIFKARNFEDGEYTEAWEPLKKPKATSRSGVFTVGRK